MTKRFFLLVATAGLTAACGPSNTGETSSATSGQGGEASSSMTTGTGGDWTERNECDLGTDTCSEKATCVDTLDFYECECLPGYEGDGYNCSDINECALGIHDCGDNATCTNEAGSHSCTCDPGFDGDGANCTAHYTNFANGQNHACAVRQDGTAWCWGAGANGRLGNDSSVDHAQPSAVVGTDWSLLAAGNTSTCGIKKDGTLWCWGRGNDGQLGINSTGTFDTPQAVGADADWEQISLGVIHTCGIRSGGELYCWGGNSHKQVGNDSSSKTLQPAAVSPSAAFSTVALGNYHSCAIKSDGSLWCWGRNSEGQLGIGSSNGTYGLPQPVGVDTDWAQLALGESYSCATKTDGAVWCWGRGAEGQLGIDDTSEKTTPHAVDIANTYAQIAAGRQTTCGLRKNDGSLWCWGNGDSGQFGDGPARNPLPVKLWDHKDWQQLGLGRNHVCGRRADNRVYCWGSNDYGQTSLGVFGQQLSPRIVKPGPTKWSASEVSGENSVGLAQDGTLWSWGRNVYGQLGLGDYSNRRAPTQVGKEANWITAVTSVNHSCALQTSNQETSLWCWGRDSNGVLGNGSSGSTFEPAPVLVGVDTDWAQLTTRWYHICGLKSGGELFCWGQNNYNQAAEGSTSSRTAPEQVDPPTTYSAASVGNGYTCAIRSDGSLWCWGRNNRSQLGLGDATTKAAPMQVGTNTNWTHVATNFEHSCGLKDDQSLWCWGYNNVGQLGFGDKVTRSTPEKIGMAAWSRISVARYHSCGVQTDGTLWCWGSGAWGRLGLGSKVSHTTPQQVGIGNDWADVRLSHDHSCAKKIGGTLLCWGHNFAGRTGHGDAWTAEPAVILEP